MEYHESLCSCPRSRDVPQHQQHILDSSKEIARSLETGVSLLSSFPRKSVKEREREREKKRSLSNSRYITEKKKKIKKAERRMRCLWTRRGLDGGVFAAVRRMTTTTGGAPAASPPPSSQPGTSPSSHLATPKAAIRRIKVSGKIVELDGDEMARIIWGLVKSRLISPFVELETEYIDLSLQQRDARGEGQTQQALEALRKIRVGVKCATVTPDADRVKEYNLKQQWRSPNSIIRHGLSGTVVREPILIKNIPRIVKTWTKPIVVVRHAFGDQYQAQEGRFGAGKLEMRFIPADGSTPQVFPVAAFGPAGGVGLSMYNTRESIEQFAQASFAVAIEKALPLILTTKNTILQKYDAMFADVFAAVYQQQQMAATFKQLGLTYEHRLLDDHVAQTLKGKGGFVWAAKNYDGAVHSEIVAAGFGSVALLTSTLRSPDGVFVAEAAHGTITRHYRMHQRGKETSTNSIASIFAWTRGLHQRGHLDANRELMEYAKMLELSTIRTVESGVMTRDLALCIHGEALRREHYTTTEGFIEAVAGNLRSMLSIQSKVGSGGVVE